MNELKQAIQNELENKKIKYSYNDDSNFFAYSVNIDNSIGNIKVIIQLMEERYLVYALISNRAQKPRMSAVAEYLHRVNYGLVDGNFEMDFSSGRICYKSFVNAKGVSISGAIISDSILVPIMMIRKYGDGLLEVMTGTDTPEAILKKIK